MKKVTYLGIDLGTSSLKLVLINLNLDIIYSFSEEYDIRSPLPGYAEQDPQVWIDATKKGFSHLSDFLKTNDYFIDGIGITGQMHSLVCLNHQHQPVRPAILWSDLRTSEIVANLNNIYPQEQWRSWLGNPIATGFALPSWLWITKFEQTSKREVQFLMQPKDFLRFWLTGELCTDPSDASASGFFDPVTEKWVPEILSLAELSEQNFPSIKSSFEMVGFVRSEIMDQFGFKGRIPVVVGGSDQAVQALAFNVTSPEDCLITIGSGGQIFSPVLTPIPDHELRINLFCHVMANTWHYEAATLSAGLSFRWLRTLLGNKLSYQQLADLSTEVGEEPDLFFLPYLNGERTPWMDPHIAGSFLGLKINHQISHLARAVMEGVVFSIGQAMEVINECGIYPESIMLSGGASQHPFWIQLLSNVLGKEIKKIRISEATGKGAALAAWIGVSKTQFAEAKNQIDQSISVEKAFSPNEEFGFLQDKFERFREIYPKIKRI